ncbi:MAG: hypothetical protein IJ747_04795 [Lachnospiraceae bacterium]|nr:hypothetical protein [Lachnospiraceae bacterium]
MKREQGSVADLMAAGIFLLALTVVMLAYMEDARLIRQKMEVQQLARQYILRMETTGYLTQEDRQALCEELETLGVTAPDVSGSTLAEVAYGERIVLEIRGVLGGEYAFREKRVSTAKN